MFFLGENFQQKILLLLYWFLFLCSTHGNSPIVEANFVQLLDANIRWAHGRCVDNGMEIITIYDALNTENMTWFHLYLPIQSVYSATVSIWSERQKEKEKKNRYAIWIIVHIHNFSILSCMSFCGTHMPFLWHKNWIKWKYILLQTIRAFICLLSRHAVFVDSIHMKIAYAYSILHATSTQ